MASAAYLVAIAVFANVLSCGQFFPNMGGMGGMGGMGDMPAQPPNSEDAKKYERPDRMSRPAGVTIPPKPDRPDEARLPDEMARRPDLIDPHKCDSVRKEGDKKGFRINIQKVYSTGNYFDCDLSATDDGKIEGCLGFNHPLEELDIVTMELLKKGPTGDSSIAHANLPAADFWVSYLVYVENIECFANGSFAMLPIRKTSCIYLNLFEFFARHFSSSLERTIYTISLTASLEEDPDVIGTLYFVASVDDIDSEEQ